MNFVAGPGRLRHCGEEMVEFDGVKVEGFMTVPPLAPAAEHSRRYFVTLCELRDKLATEFRFPLPELSMGMSNDFRVAIEEGATMVRVGTAIFGERRR